MSFPLALPSQISVDHLLYPFFCAVLEARDLSPKNLKGNHFFQHQIGNLLCSHLSLWSWLNIAHVPTTYVDFFTFVQYTLVSHVCVFASPSKTAVRILSFHLLEPLPKHTYSKAVEIFFLRVTDLYSDCLWGWSILLKFQPMFFSLAFFLVSIAISLSILCLCTNFLPMLDSLAFLLPQSSSSPYPDTNLHRSPLLWLLPRLPGRGGGRRQGSPKWAPSLW